MSKRRNPFDDKSPAKETLPKPPDIYESLRVAEPRQRNREWEKRHQSQKAVYRGVDPELVLQVKNIASEFSVRNGEVARFFLEHALHAYKTGKLKLMPSPNPTRLRMTLFPSQILSDEKGELPSHKSRRKKTGIPRWKVITTWRGFPPELKAEISELSSEGNLDVPAGELITALLRFSLRAYEHGSLKLKPVAEVRGYTLREGGRF